MNDRYPFRTLPDYLRRGLDLVFVGINPGLYSVQREHYFARSTNRFWPAFTASELSERVRPALGTNILGAEHDAELLPFRIGFTDVVKRPSSNAADLNVGDSEIAKNQCSSCDILPMSCGSGLAGWRRAAKAGALSSGTKHPTTIPMAPSGKTLPKRLS